MHTFLRHTATGQYFHSLDSWTPDRDDAYDFGPVARAMKFAQKTHLPDLELVVAFDDPSEVSTKSLGQLCQAVAHGRAV
jgi:hypothetical protein